MEQGFMLDGGEWILLITAGFAAGVVNTLAGSGSVFTLTLLLFLGLPADVANATNRIGIWMQSASASAAFAQKGLIVIKGVWHMVIVAVAFAVLGAYAAAGIDLTLLKKVFGGFMLFLLPVILWGPGKWLPSNSEKDFQPKKWVEVILFAAIGFYGGFLQAGLGIFMVTALVSYCRLDPVRANALKVFIIMVYTLPALGVFLWQGKLNWGYGLAMAIGQTIGGLVTARLAISKAWVVKGIKWLLIIMILVTVTKLFIF